jgi:phosphinothricin acetyltransferase
VSAVVRPAREADAAAIATIFRQGIEDRVATFETNPPDEAAIAELVGAGGPVLVAEESEAIAGWAKVSPYDPVHDYYAGVGEATIYVARDRRGAGVGAALLEALAHEAARAGYFKLVGKLFTTNSASIALFQGHGWRPVGVHHRHGRLDGEWKDVLVVEKLVGEAAAEPL